MRSDIAAKAPENKQSQHQTPHNHVLRIICPADIDPMAGGVVGGLGGFGNDADPFGLDAQGDDLTLEFCTGFLERTNVSYVTSP